MNMIFRFYIGTVILSLSGAVVGVDHDLGASVRFRYADLSVDNLRDNTDLADTLLGNEGKRDESESSVMFRLSADSLWTDTLSTFTQVDYVVSSVRDREQTPYNAILTLPDDPGLDVNQIYFTLDVDEYQLRVGRQTLAWDHQRFIGTNGFWQNEQSFDAAMAFREIGENSNIRYAYIANANRIGGDTQAHQSHLLRVEVNEWDYSKVVGYSYFIKNKDQKELSSKTLGLSYLLKLKPELVQYRLEADMAFQSAESSADDELLPYFRMDIGVAVKSTELSWRYEYLGATDSNSFSAPLGSLHEFNGWADMFTTSPVNGLQDNSIRLTFRRSPIKIDLRYHLFSEAQGRGLIGSEFDFDIIYKPKRNHKILLRFSDFKVNDERVEDYFDSRRFIVNYTYSI